ncbi:MAG: HD domain-containing phosphohydrolase [Thiohalospira sp.]
MDGHPARRGRPSVDLSALVFECLEAEHAHQEWLHALDALPDPLLLHDEQGRILRVNRAYAERAGAEFDDLIGEPYWQWFPRLEGPLEESSAIAEGADFRTRDLPPAGGVTYRLLAYAVKEPETGRRFAFLIFRDVSQQLRGEQSEAFFSGLAWAAPDPVLVMDPGGRLTFWNEAAERTFGYTSEEVLGQPLHPLLAGPAYQDRYEQGLARFRDTGEGPVVGQTQELEARRKDGSVFPVELSVSAVPLGDGWHALGILRDITERKTREQRLQRLTGFLRALLRANSALVKAESEPALFQSVCEALTSSQGYPLAWVGLAETDPDRSVRVAGAAGERTDYLEAIRVSWDAESPLGQGPTGRAIRTGTSQQAGLERDPQFEPWREPARQRGFGASIAVPVADGDRVLGALNVYAASPEAFDQEGRELLENLAADIGYGVRALRTQAERDQSRTELRRALLGTVEVIARTVEMRDPYTAGHQRRVAELATAIGARLGLSGEQLEGLHVAGLIHDVGKISVPPELLSYPGELSDHQFALIKDHVREGHAIIQGVDFPWPVKEAVLQHHERLDGSGYPAGLSGDEITLEGRILGVADVVEAVSSHRPYRPALGREEALAIIRQDRGTRLDPAVVDACIAVFEEEGFQWDAGTDAL